MIFMKEPIIKMVIQLCFQFFETRCYVSTKKECFGGEFLILLRTRISDLFQCF